MISKILSLVLTMNIFVLSVNFFVVDFIDTQQIEVVQEVKVHALRGGASR